MEGIWIAFIGVILTLMILAFFLGIIQSRKHGHTKTVCATVVNKQKYEVFSKYSGTGKIEKHCVTFLINGKRKIFDVSEFSYNGYHKGETGTLKYKGDRLIDFS